MLVFIYTGGLGEQHGFGSFRNNITRPAELLNQFGGDAAVHRDSGRGAGGAAPEHSPSDPKGSGQSHSPASPCHVPGIWGAPFLGAG